MITLPQSEQQIRLREAMWELSGLNVVDRADASTVRSILSSAGFVGEDREALVVGFLAAASGVDVRVEPLWVLPVHGGPAQTVLPSVRRYLAGKP